MDWGVIAQTCKYVERGEAGNTITFRIKFCRSNIVCSCVMPDVVSVTDIASVTGFHPINCYSILEELIVLIDKWTISTSL